ncbi:hypothetical protein [Christiangramia portivictoriae]|uniref:hypothetical protein n=1 Tax=Christiangramia portivictoriae TaxID=326069 RepID=UPI0003FE48D3|nr:hypothetical protein [Christiangramia portivictoriae]
MKISTYPISKILLLFSFAFICSCDTGDDSNYAEFDYSDDSKIEAVETDRGFDISITEGDMLVFEYIFETEGREEVADDEFAQRLYFEIPAGTQEFELDSESFATASAYLGRSCFCGITGNYPVNAGSISGRKISSNTFAVTIDIQVNFEDDFDTYQLQTSANFKRRN